MKRSNRNSAGPKTRHYTPQPAEGERLSSLEVRVLKALREGRWVAPGQRVGVAVSGGADSVALFGLLLRMRQRLGNVLSVVHFNHQLRGRASEADEKFVASLAAERDVPFFVERQNISEKSKREGSNLEDAARRARYAFFERMVAEGKVDKVAVAHTADDQAETVVAHILRGTGLTGLGGIHPELACVFRPLLGIRRAELREYLRAERQSWREDATNRDRKRTRARIRLKLMPLLEKEFQPAVVEHLCQLAEMAREDEAWLESSAELRLFLNARENDGEWSIALKDLVTPQWEWERGQEVERIWTRRAPEAMSKRMIRLLVKRVKPQSGQLSSVHVEAVMRLACQPDSGKRLQLPGGVQVRRSRECLTFRAAESFGRTKDTPEAKRFEYPVHLRDGAVDVPLLEQSLCLRFTVIDWPAEGRETRKTGAVLDRKRLSLPLVVRNWRPGDSMQPVGHRKQHRLSRLLNELGVSRWEKSGWPVVECGGRIAWTRGLPAAVEFAADSATRKGVVITEVRVSW
jgi:tRNA(Ile)-lysidine synthase